ncbi:PREDICTED: centrosomal protein of 41 kDa isoform X2 [Nanorana parkeri]|uniref:centrosomal protein of 41 kDa isoform X2 n=1 Tax=Nanorana parkeri TaxID=125878 RepID=UPI000853F0D7|nr:PREDICTED: centrosomal protein of 41 kDa isoform X2 [Nanorana parkeri]
MSARRHIGDAEILKKRIPQNPKYQHVKSRLDTGSSMTKYMERIEEMKRNYRYKKDELFKRIKVTTFAQLVVQVASVSEESDAEITSEELQRLEDNSSVMSEADTELPTDRTNGKHSPGSVPLSSVELIDNKGDGDFLSSARSTLQSVISGVGELDRDNDPKKQSKKGPSSSSGSLDKPYPDCPYLLLDARDRECYDQCHVVGAHHYPIAMLSRTMNPFTPEILNYKNAQGKIIIIYDEDERIATLAATTMCERGFENLFMLSGGLKVIAQRFPDGLTTGTFPATCLTQPVQPKSARRHATPREPVLPAENKWRFSSQDLEKIEQHLEKMLMPANTAKSKSAYSRNSHIPSSASSVSSQSVRSISPHSKPWK